MGVRYGREERGTQKESISFQKHRSRLKSERGTKEKRPSNEKERKRVGTHAACVVLLMKMNKKKIKNMYILYRYYNII